MTMTFLTGSTIRKHVPALVMASPKSGIDITAPALEPKRLKMAPIPICAFRTGTATPALASTYCGLPNAAPRHPLLRTTHGGGQYQHEYRMETGLTLISGRTGTRAGVWTKLTTRQEILLRRPPAAEPGIIA